MEIASRVLGWEMEKWVKGKGRRWGEGKGSRSRVWGHPGVSMPGRDREGGGFVRTRCWQHHCMDSEERVKRLLTYLS